MPRRPLPTFQSWVAMTVLAAVAGYVAWDAGARGAHVLTVSASRGMAVQDPVGSSASPTGYADGNRSLILPTGASDTAHWIMQTQAMVAAGDWRVRRVDYDNAPHGREVHWAAPLRWWLASLAWVDRALSGRPVGQSIERAAVYSGPAMFALMLAGVGCVLGWRFSPLAPVFFGLGAIATMPFYLDFFAGYADHHGLANLCGLLTVLLLTAGAREKNRAGRRWLAASAVAGGIGLWISAATMAPVLVSLGLGLLAAGWLERGTTPRLGWLAEPANLRIWARVGGGVSLLAWFVEYFPRHLSWRLEVNHPLYALAWLGAGELLYVAMLAFRDGWRSVPARERAAGVAGVVLLLALPATIACTASRTFLVADPFLWRLHVQYISEFQGLDRILRRGWSWTAASLCLPALLLLPPLGAIMRRAPATGRRGLLVVAAVPALVGCLMAWNQVRWLSLAFSLLIPLLAVFFETSRTRSSFLGWVTAGFLVFGPGLGMAVKRTLRSADFTTEDLRSLAEREVALWLRQRTGPGPQVVAASPSVTNKLIFHASATGVGTLYWENLAGLKNAAAFFAAPPSLAREMARRAGLTHVVFVSWAAFETSLVRLDRGLPDAAPLPAGTLIQALGGQPVPPPWLMAVPFKLPKHPALEGQRVQIWEVVPDQAPANALARAANYHLELGQWQHAAHLAPALAAFESDLSAMVMLAGIASRDQDREGFAAAFSRVLAQLPQAPALALDEHIHLVVVLAVGQRPQLAQAQLREAMKKADERGLRRLSVGTLNDLLALSDGLQVPLPTPELRRLAVDLVPLDLRK